MDKHEATTTVMSRIQNLDPENASRIMGYLLIQDPDEKEMIRLAHSPDAVLLSYVNQGKAFAQRLTNAPPSPRISIPGNNGFNLSPISYPGVLNNSDFGPVHHGFQDDDGPMMSPSGVRPCMYYAKGFCKMGSSCKFTHSDEAIEELMRMKALQDEQRFGYGNFVDFVNENQGTDFSTMGLDGDAYSSSRQIYLTFPSDSSFREEDVSDYFNTFGPVQDVRIPYQQKRMFGFVTFLYPQTVRIILEHGNPHFVCDSRVLVKPYKEKGKSLENKQLQQHLTIGPRMLFKSQKMMLRRKLEQEAGLQHAIELQRRRMMNLHVMGPRNQHRDQNNYLPNMAAARVPISSPRQPQSMMVPNVSSDFNNREVLQADDELSLLEGMKSSNNNHIDIGNKQQQHLNDEDSDFSLEHVLPYDLFASPTKVAGDRQSVFGHASDEADGSSMFLTTNTRVPPPGSSPLGMANPWYFPMTSGSCRKFE